MAEHEIELRAEVAALPKLVLGYKVRFGERAKQYGDTVLGASNLTPEELQERCEASETLGDLVSVGVARAATVADPEYRDALARLAVAALEDDARIDEIALIQSQLVQLEPAHLRILVKLEALQNASTKPTVSFAVSYTEDWGGLSEAAVLAGLERLAGLGLVGFITLQVSDDQRDLVPPRDWAVSRWGREALAVLREAGGMTP